jgi:hypothetical protein
MTIKTNKQSGWHDPNFEPHEGPVASDDFAPLGLTGSASLRDFLNRQTQANLSGNKSSETLGKGIYLHRLSDGSYELLVYRGRSTYDCYPGATRQELLDFANLHFLKES